MFDLKHSWPLLLAGALGLAAATAPAPDPPPTPSPAGPNCPGPDCPAPKPAPRPSPWGTAPSPAVAGAAVTENFLAPDGTECQNPLPREFHLKNRGGSDGSGLCVPWDTTVCTRTGAVRICDLDPSRHEILFHDGRGRLAYTSKFLAKKTGRVRSLVRLQTGDGKFLDCTPDHRVCWNPKVGQGWSEDDRFAFRAAEDLRRGDSVWTLGEYRGGDARHARTLTSAACLDVEPVDVWDVQNFDDCWAGEGNFFANGFLVHNCVFCSIQHEAVWQDVEPLKDFFRWMWTKPGGGYPDKVERMIEQISREKGLPVPDYIQVENNDLEILKLACRAGRSPGVTYAYSPTGRYGGQRIAHMVSLVHADDRWFGILDNNYPGSVEWMSPQEFLRSYSGGQQGWAVILLNPGPPPPPRAARPVPPREPRAAMNRESLLPLLAALPLLTPPAAYGGWGSGGCAPGPGGFSTPFAPAPALAAAPESYSWKPVPGDADQRALYRGPTQLGVWRLDLGKYFALLPGDRWEPADCPAAPPDGWEQAARDAKSGGARPDFQALPTGVERDKCAKDGSVYKVNGKQVPKEQAYQAIGAPNLVDDSAFLRLTLTGDEATRKRVLADLASDPYLQTWKDRLVLKSYPADHWAVRDLGFLAPGKAFSLLVQAPSGEVLHRQDDYDGAAAFAGALRKVDPLHKPDRDPDLRKDPDPVQSLWEEVKKLPPLLWLAAGGLGLYWFFNRKKS